MEKVEKQEPYKGICCARCWMAKRKRCKCKCKGKHHGKGRKKGEESSKNEEIAVFPGILHIEPEPKEEQKD